MNRLQEIFDKQKELMVNYHPIEKASGLMTTDECPVDIDSQAGQARLRDFAWRFTEEIGEALDEYYSNNKELTPEVQEEFIDSLHFLTEMSILIGVKAHEVYPIEAYDLDNLVTLTKRGAQRGFHRESIEVIVTELITSLSMMINTLKNKAWKQTMRQTDTELFFYRFGEVWLNYFALIGRVGLSDSDVYQMYMFKNQKNKQRQQNKY